MGKDVPSLQSVQTDRSAVLTVMSGLDPHMINLSEHGIKLSFIVVIGFA